MARYNPRIVFIDGFAGPGRYANGEDGSPIIAMKALLDHSYLAKQKSPAQVVFWFIERAKDRVAELRASVSELEAQRPVPDWVRIEIVQGEFAPSLEAALDDLDRASTTLAPTLAFIDPFGFKGIPLRLVARLMKNPKCECLINFSFESINRFLDHPNLELTKHFDELFGAPDWSVIRSISDRVARRDAIIHLYRAQLYRLAKVKYTRTFEMRDEGNRTEYFLVFGTNDLLGLTKMKEAMWKADPERGVAFSDRTNPDQLVLFAPGEESGLQAVLSKQFRGKGFVSIDEIEQFVLVDTPFSETRHLKKRSLAPMEKASPPRIEVKRPPGSRSRSGTYPEGTAIRFL
jgi:three-Cys-motif partner protein